MVFHTDPECMAGDLMAADEMHFALLIVVSFAEK
jgi:hypothetical protein